MKFLERRFRIIAFDWDGTAVANRREPVGELLPILESLLRKRVKLVIITGTHFGNIDGQFCRHVTPSLKRDLYACVNRGSEVYGFDEAGEPHVVQAREAKPEENEAMDTLSSRISASLRQQNRLETQIISDRLNRRKLDLIPVPEWADPPKERIGELLVATEKRLRDHGIKGGIKEVIDRVAALAKELHPDLRITTDVKHIEYGLTDKSESVRFVVKDLAKDIGAINEDILFLGDEFGPIGGFEGSDFRMVTDLARGATYVSVGKEPNGVPDGVIHYGGGKHGFQEIMKAQIALWEKESS